ncbi:hypothetical protein ETI08_01035 [Macrococcoides goetzii]|nr:hypothetical protein [Macrococcus goetzii]TDM47748.1 hypothetical protein ETI08_01035 [Macrococcus goetzii]
MIDDPYKLVRDILVNSKEVTSVIPATNIKNATIPSNLLTSPPYIRISITDIRDENFADGQIYAGGLYVQIDIWQKDGLLTVGNKIKKLLKSHGFNFIDMMEPGTEKINDNVTLFRDARRYFYGYELNEDERY